MLEASIQAKHATRLLLHALEKQTRLADLSLREWDLLIRVARRHRLLARLESDLFETDKLESVPERVLNHLLSAGNRVRHQQTLLTWEVNRILWALGDSDVPVIVLKGAAYALAGLPAAEGRLFADLDLLVPRTSIDSVESSLLASGWFSINLKPYDNRYYRLWMHEIPPLRHRERGTEIDIHHTILPLTGRFQPDASLLFSAAVTLSDPNVKILSPPDMILHAAVHLFLEGDPKEGLRFRDLVDIRDLLNHFGQKPGFWEELVPRAKALNLERPLYYSLRYTRKLLGTQIPDAVLREAEIGAPSRFTRAVMDRLVPLAILPEHPDYPRRIAALARWLIYTRSHWLRMPPTLLVRHLSYKAWLRLRGVTKKTEPTLPDPNQQ